MKRRRSKREMINNIIIFFSPSSTWFLVLSELFVNIAAAWFGLVFIETQLSSVRGFGDVSNLIFKFLIGILSLVIAKVFRSRGEK